MQLDRQHTSFGRHETFPLRFGWLPKSMIALRDDAALFDHPESAMRRLGVGRNMVNAIHYWLRVCGLVSFEDSPARITALGDALLGPDADPYLEDDATLWIIHWLIATNAELATAFFWFFNRFAAPRFTEADALGALTDFAAAELRLNRAATTLKSDISTLLRLYAAVPGRTDEHLDALLAPLGLIEADPEGGYRSPRAPRPFLPLVALEFALAQRFAAEPDQPALSVRGLLYAEGDWVAPDAVFRLSEDGLMRHLDALLAAYPGRYELRDTAGLHHNSSGSSATSAPSLWRSCGATTSGSARKTLYEAPECEPRRHPAEKITHYLLSDDHPVGRHKARFFRACGFSKTAWRELEAALLRRAVEHPVYQKRPTPFGVSYSIDGSLPSPDGRAPPIRAIWFREAGQNAPTFVTAYPLKARRIE